MIPAGTIGHRSASRTPSAPNSDAARKARSIVAAIPISCEPIASHDFHCGLVNR